MQNPSRVNGVMTHCWLPAELELGTCGTEQTPKGKGHLAAGPGCPHCSANLTTYPKPTRFLRFFERDYSGGEGKKGEFVMLNLSSLNFLRSYNIFILKRNTTLQILYLELQDNLGLLSPCLAYCKLEWGQGVPRFDKMLWHPC